MIKLLTCGLLPGLAGLLTLGLSTTASASIMYSADSNVILTIDALPAAVTASFENAGLDTDVNANLPPGTAGGSSGASVGPSPGADSDALIIGDNVFANSTATGNAADGASFDGFGEATTVLLLENTSGVAQTIALTFDYFVFAAAMVDSAASEDANASATVSVESLILNTVLFEFFVAVDTFLDGSDAEDGSNIPTSVSFNVIVPAGTTEEITIFSAADGEGLSAELAVVDVPLPGSLILLAFGGLLIQRRQPRR